MDGLSELYQELLSGSYDCVDRIVLNAYFGLAHSPGGFRVWWRALTGSDETLDNAHLMRLAGRFSRRVRGYAKAHDIPVVDCTAGQRKHDVADDYLARTTVTEGLFLVLVGRAQAPVWHVGANYHLEKKTPYVTHYSFHILDRDRGHVTIKISGHPPFPAQVMLNGHEYVACQARKAGIVFIKEGNCFTAITDTPGFAWIAATLSEQRAVGRLSEVCERWIYRCCLCFALDFEEQKRSGFRYHFSNYQMEYSRNLIFLVGGRMEQVFQALIDRSRAPLDLKTIKTILGDKGRPKYRPRNMKAAEWEVAVERPAYDLTVFKLHCGRLALKIYSKGERVLRIEAVAHNIREFNCGRLLDNFPEIVRRLKAMLERFMQVLSCIDQCFIGDEMLECLPLPVRVGKSMVGGIAQPISPASLRRGSHRVVCLARRLHRLGTGRSGSRVRRQKRICLRSPPGRIRPEETARQTGRPADRLDASVRRGPVRSACGHRLTRAPRESHQTAARGCSRHHPHARRTKSTSHRSSLPGPATRDEGRL